MQEALRAARAPALWASHEAGGLPSARATAQTVGSPMATGSGLQEMPVARGAAGKMTPTEPEVMTQLLVSGRMGSESQMRRVMRWLPTVGKLVVKVWS